MAYWNFIMFYTWNYRNFIHLEFEFYSFPSLHNKGDKNGPLAQLPPLHKNVQIE